MEFRDWYGFSVVEWNVPLPLPGVYLVINRESGLKYVGSSQNIESRFSNGWRQSDHGLLGKAMVLEGRRSFLVMPLCYVLSKREHLGQIEEDLIDKWGTLFPNGYNAVCAGLPSRVFSAIGNDPVLEEARIKGIVAYSRTAEAQERFHQQWTNPEIKQLAVSGRLNSTAWLLSVQRPRTVDEIAKVQTPEARAKRTASLTDTWSDKALRQAQSVRLTDYLSDHPDVREKRIEQVRAGQEKATDAAAGIVRGSEWFTNGTESKRIRAGDLVPDGWMKGRAKGVRFGPKTGSARNPNAAKPGPKPKVRKDN